MSLESKSGMNIIGKLWRVLTTIVVTKADFDRSSRRDPTDLYRQCVFLWEYRPILKEHVRPQISQVHTFVVVVVAAFRFARLLHSELVLSASNLSFTARAPGIPLQWSSIDISWGDATCFKIGLQAILVPFHWTSQQTMIAVRLSCLSSLSSNVRTFQAAKCNVFRFKRRCLLVFRPQDWITS